MLSSLLIALGVLLLLGGLFIWGAIAVIRSAIKEGRSLPVLLPEGVVECYRGKTDKTTALRFDRIRRMDMNTQTVVTTDSEGKRHSSTNYWLNVYDTAARYQKWGLRQTYGDPIVTLRRRMNPRGFFCHSSVRDALRNGAWLRLGAHRS